MDAYFDLPEIDMGDVDLPDPDIPKERKWSDDSEEERAVRDRIRQARREWEAASAEPVYEAALAPRAPPSTLDAQLDAQLDGDGAPEESATGAQAAY